VGLMLGLRMVVGGSGRPLYPLRTMLAGGLVGLAHLQSWLLVRADGIEGSYYHQIATSYAFCAIATVVALDAFGPAVIATLLSPPQSVRVGGGDGPHVERILPAQPGDGLGHLDEVGRLAADGTRREHVGAVGLEQE
jgi:hypothetical protein